MSSIGLNIEFAGEDNLFARIDKLESSFQLEVGSVYVELGKRIVREIQERYVPVDVGLQFYNETTDKFKAWERGDKTKGYPTVAARSFPGFLEASKKHSGTLRDSVGSSEQPELLSNGGVGISIWAGREGSGAEEYAAVQHENLLFRHLVGQAKYIEIPVMLICPPEMAPNIVKAIQKAMSSAWT